jgi:aspartyl-tRNA(Asn)/glutamyl-tRNA(Gln) amidotransferase subunit C
LVPELDRDEVAKVAGLAMLELTDEELDTFTPQLVAILAHAQDVEDLDVHDVPPTHHPYPLVNVTRPDVVAADSGGPDLRDAVLAEAPDVEDNRFKVPPALGEEP